MENYKSNEGKRQQENNDHAYQGRTKKMDHEEFTSSTRSDARERVAKKWANRRRQQSGLSTRSIRSTIPEKTGPLTLCSVIRQTWDDALRSFSQPRQFQEKKIVKPSKRRKPFPSVLNILQEHVLKDQMEQFELSLLPADYDFQRAIHNMSESRSRVFLLLDLAAITQTHVRCRKLFPKARLTYSTKHNASARLLVVLGRLGMDLTVGTKFDLETCRQHCRGIQFWDDPSCTGKTNSYYRRLVLDAPKSVASSTPLTVDGPNEVLRLASAITQMSQRRQQELPILQFILKVDGLLEEWQDALSNTEAATSGTPHQLVGISLDLLERKGTLSDSLAFLSNVLAYCRDSLGMDKPQLHLSAPDLIDQVLVDWLAENAVSYGLCSLDISHILVKNAGAICARIIGVKQNEATKIHYYIDDGCYGSLSNHSKSTVPIPLKAKTNSDNDLPNYSPDAEATVWGPTCDGIDKVCMGKLPMLCRDDWLVFGNTGFCDVGTTFNGFAPPDVVYCALGGVLYPSESSRRDSFSNNTIASK